MKLLNKLENRKALVYAHDLLKKDKEFVKLLFGDLEISCLDDIKTVEDILEYMDEDLFEEKDLALFVLDKFHNSVEGLLNSIEKNDDEALDDVLDVYEDFFEELDNDLRANKEIVLKMFAIGDDFKKTLTKEAGYSENMIDECLDFIEDCFEEIDEDLLEDEEFMKELIEMYPYMIDFKVENEDEESVFDKKEDIEDIKVEECECKECSCVECDCKEKNKEEDSNKNIEIKIEEIDDANNKENK